MGKRIIQQRRGRGGSTYRVRAKASQVDPKYLPTLKGDFMVVNLISSVGHSSPIARLRNSEGSLFETIAAHHLYVGQKICVGGTSQGDIAQLKDLPHGTEVFNIESSPRDGGKFARSGGNFATILGVDKNKIKVLMPSRKEKKFNGECRASIGRAAGHGRMEKPILKAGKKHYIMRSKSKLWPRTSAVAMNAIDHPFGSGRGKRVKSKISKRNASPGKKVGLLRPKRTGRKKR